MCRNIKEEVNGKLGRIIVPPGRHIGAQAGIYSAGPELSQSTGIPGLGRNSNAIPAWASSSLPRLGICPGWAVPPRPGLLPLPGRASVPRPASASRAGSRAPASLRFPTRPSRPGWAAVLRIPGGPSSSPGRLPRLGRGLVPRPGWAAGLPVPAGPLGWLTAGPPGRAPGWAGMIHPLLDRDIIPGWACLSIPAGPLLFYCSGRARPGFPGPGRIIPLQGRYLLPPGHIPHPASSPAHRASPGTPPGSDWHILHRHMLVLGRL
jgi:hypothetical protein